MFASPCLRFKGGMVPITTLELLRFDPTRLAQDLADKIQQAPNLFKNLPLILSLEKLEGSRSAVDIAFLRRLCSDHGTPLVGIRTDHSEDQRLAAAAGLAVLSPGRHSRASAEDLDESRDLHGQTRDTVSFERSKATSPEFAVERGSDLSDSRQTRPQPATAEPESAAAKGDGPAETPNKIVRAPIRSGQQVYAPGGDLILLAQVSAGAEILADGNIHAYAPMRGRALAGVRGDNNACFFCQSLEAELVSIAGEYKLSDDLRGALWQKPAHIELKDGKMVIAEL